MLAALLLAVSLTAPAALPDASHAPASPTQQLHKSSTKQKKAAPVLAQARLADDPNSPDRDPGFVDHFMPFQLAATALPQVKDGLVMAHVLGYLGWGLCGGLWGPVVAVDGAEFTGDVILSWFVSGLIYGVIASVATFTLVGAAVWLAVPYFQTTAVLNAIDRDLKKKGVKAPGAPAGQKPTGTTPPPTGGTGETPPPSYAY